MIINVNVKTNSKSPGITKTAGGLDIKIRERPVDGKANEAIVEMLSNYFDIPKSLIKIKKGIKSKHKSIEICLQ